MFQINQSINQSIEKMVKKSNIRLYTRKIGPQRCSANPKKVSHCFLAVIFCYVQRRREPPPFDGVENFRSTVHFRGVLIPHDRLRRAPRLSLRHTGFLGHTGQCRHSASASRALHLPNHHKTRHHQRSASRTGRITKTSLNCVPLFFPVPAFFWYTKKCSIIFSTYKNEEDFSQYVIFFGIFFWILFFYFFFGFFFWIFFWIFFLDFFSGFFLFCSLFLEGNVFLVIFLLSLAAASALAAPRQSGGWWRSPGRCGSGERSPRIRSWRVCRRTCGAFSTLTAATSASTRRRALVSAVRCALKRPPNAAVWV